MKDMRPWLCAFRKLPQRFQYDSSAVTSIEFAILAAPFFFVMFAIIETSISFTAQQMLSHSAERIARSFKVNLLNSTNTDEAKLREKVCDGLSVFFLADCNQVVVDLQVYPSIKDIPTAIPYDLTGDIDTSTFKVQPGNSDTLNHLRVFYRWPWYTDLIRSRFSNLPNGRTLLFSSETWRNEP